MSKAPIRASLKDKKKLLHIQLRLHSKLQKHKTLKKLDFCYENLNNKTFLFCIMIV